MRQGFLGPSDGEVRQGWKLDRRDQSGIESTLTIGALFFGLLGVYVLGSLGVLMMILFLSALLLCTLKLLEKVGRFKFCMASYKRVLDSTGAPRDLVELVHGSFVAFRRSMMKLLFGCFTSISTRFQRLKQLGREPAVAG